MKSLSFTRFLAVLLVVTSCTEKPQSNEKPGDESKAARYDQILSEKLSTYAALPASADNPDNLSSPAKVRLGYRLYYDTRLSRDGNNSCNSCHNLKTYGVDNLPTSPGDLGGNGDRNSPTTLNAALHFKQFWDGRSPDVEDQAGGPVLNPVEMNMPSKEFMVSRLVEDEKYMELFSDAFPSETKPVTFTNMQKAIAAFERELITPSRFDQYLLGNKEALSLQEKKGLLSFTLIGCNTCHNGPLLGGNQFQRFGVYKPYWEATKSKNIDKGLAGLTSEELDEYLFKVPSLRNVTETHPYFHDGSVESLADAIRIMADIQLDYKMNESEVENILAFMGSLKGEVPKEYQENPFAQVE